MKKYYIILVVVVAMMSNVNTKAASFLTLADYAAAENFLPAPPDTIGQAFASDWMIYNWTKGLRNANATQVMNDASLSAITLCKVFSPAFGTTISSAKTRQLYLLLMKLVQDINYATSSVKAKYARKHPFQQMNENSMLANYDATVAKTGSYVSEHAAAGWATALILAEINVDRQDTILSRGYQFGQSRVIAGCNYQTDVEAGRVVGMSTVARLHADAGFMSQLALAKEEFASITAVSAPAYNLQSTNGYFNTQGMQVDESNMKSGEIYIHNGKKALKGN